MVSHKIEGGNGMQSMDEIYQQYSSTVYKYLLCLSGDAHLAEDLTQETFAIAVSKIHQFRAECKVSTWLCQIAKHLWYKELKKEKKLPTEELTENLVAGNMVEDLFLQKEEKLQLFRNVQKLDELPREVVYLRIMGNLSFTEIAEVLGKTTNWARVTFFRAKQKIKEEPKNG